MTKDMTMYKRDHKRLQRYRAKQQADAELQDEDLVTIETRKRSEKAAMKAKAKAELALKT